MSSSTSTPLSGVPETLTARYEIRHSPKFSFNRDHHQKRNCDPCIVCGKAVSSPKHFVRLFWGSTAVTEAEANKIIAEEGEGGDLLYYPVGADCLRRQPELKPFVEDAKRANERFAVQNLTASVEVYERPVEAPFAWNSPVTDASETLAPELDIEWISAGDTVLVSAPYRKPFYGVVEVVDVEAQTGLVWHAQGGYYVGTFSVEDMKLITKKTPANEFTSVS